MHFSRLWEFLSESEVAKCNQFIGSCTCYCFYGIAVTVTRIPWNSASHWRLTDVNRDPKKRSYRCRYGPAGLRGAVFLAPPGHCWKKRTKVRFFKHSSRVRATRARILCIQAISDQEAAACYHRDICHSNQMTCRKGAQQLSLIIWAHQIGRR